MRNLKVEYCANENPLTNSDKIECLSSVNVSNNKK